MQVAVCARAPDVFDCSRWGLPPDAAGEAADRLHRCWERYHDCFTTRTHDTSKYAWYYLRGITTMDSDRDYANIARRVISPDDSGQNLQQFMSDSPWDARAVFIQIQADIAARPELVGGVLTLDDSGKKRSGDQSAGAGRQHVGREHRTVMGQVGVHLGYYHQGAWLMVDAELYLPANWFNAGHAALRQRLHIPAGRIFQTKTELGFVMVLRALTNGLPFAVVTCDSWYGRDGKLRAALDAMEQVYVAEVPEDTRVYLERPTVVVPEKQPGVAGPHFRHPRVVSEGQPIAVRDLLTHPDLALRPVEIRHTERGMLTYDCAARRVFTLGPDGRVREECLFIRQEPDDTFSFALSNAAVETSLRELAQWRSERYFAERVYEDAKGEAGWDELVARKYRAWMHHTAIDALALWFVAETKLDWRRQHPRDPELANQLQVAELPALSMANVRELLKAAMPLPQLTAEQASRLVAKHLVNRSRSTHCRLEAQRRNRAAT